MSSNNLDASKKQIENSNVLNTNISVESLEINNIKRETYYKMKFIMNTLDKNWAIKKRNNVFYLKNLDNSTKEIITEDYLNKRVIQKIYSVNNEHTSTVTIPTKEFQNKEKNNVDSTEIKENQELKTKKKEDIVPLKQGILALKERIDNGKMDVNKELKNEIYVMIFLMNTLDNGWSVRKKNNNFVFRKKHNDKKEIYSDNYLVNFLKSNIKNIV